MRAGFFNVEFEWPVASNGYRLVKTEIADSVEPPELFYVVTPYEGPVLSKKAFDEFPGLFKEFASIEPTADGVLRFAGKFGLLQQDRENELIWWLQYQRDFVELIDLKGRAKLHDLMAEKSRLWNRSFPTIIQVLSQLEGLEIALPGSRLGALDRLNRILQTGITAKICWDGRAAGIIVEPTSLLAAMALHLGLWLGTETEYIGQCVVCGSTWEFGPGTGHRKSRQYCSPKCQEAARYSRTKSRMD